MQLHALHMRSVAHCAPASLTLATFHHWHPLKCSLQRRSSHVVAAQRPTLETEVPRIDPDLDDELSERPLNLDAAGYYVIRIDKDAKEIIADYYTNIINKNGKLLSSYRKVHSFVPWQLNLLPLFFVPPPFAKISPPLSPSDLLFTFFFLICRSSL